MAKNRKTQGAPAFGGCPLCLYGCQRLVSLLALSPFLQFGFRHSVDNAARGDIVLSHVTFGYKSRPVLRDFSMTVKEGEQVTLIGRTGAGKSTVFRLLLGLYRPEAGSVTIGGVDVGKITDRERRSCIGCVEQHFSRVPGTVTDQITLGDPRITKDHVCKAAELAGMDEAIRSLPDGYDTVCTDGMFSQGEWQLLSVARRRGRRTHRAFRLPPDL